MKIKLMLGDCLDEMKKIPDNYVDSIVSDPPAGISFMGKDWDHDKGGRDNWIEWMKDIMIEAKRTLKPGGHCLIWSLPRTSHWTATALEDAGFEIRDVITHVFGSGFPKSHNIGKAIDAKIKTGHSSPSYINKSEISKTTGEVKEVIQPNNGILGDKRLVIKNIGADLESDEAKQYEGWGTALKPASEHWILCRKPLSEKTIADNVLKWGTGGINIDKSRIGSEVRKGQFAGNKETGFTNSDERTDSGKGMFAGNKEAPSYNIEGRFPANFIHDGSDEVMIEFDKAGVLKSSKRNKNYQENYTGNGHSDFLVGSANPNNTYGDEGSAARFFYCSKPSGREKNEGLDDFEDKKLCQCGYGTDWHSEKQNDIGLNKIKISKNNHPTPKAVKLMSYLINMITPINGIVLDMFMGGSTGVAAVKNNFNFIGIEKEEDYMDIAKARIEFSKK